MYCVTRWRPSEETYYKGYRGGDLLHGNRLKFIFGVINGPHEEKRVSAEDE